MAGEELSGAELRVLKRLLARSPIRSKLSVPEGEEERGPRPPAVREPSLPRTYRTSVFDVPGTGACLEMLSVPVPSFYAVAYEVGGGEWMMPQGELLEGLGIAGAFTVPARYLLAGMIVTLLDAGTSAELEWDTSVIWPVQGMPGPEVVERLVAVGDEIAQSEPGLLRFVSQVAVEAIVPIESSAPQGRSLASIASSAGATLLLGQLGHVEYPVLVIAFPLGIVLVGGAVGIAQGLQEGLYRRIVKWLTGEDPGPPSETPVQPEPGL